MRVLVRLLVTLLVLAVIAVMADRGADLYAERRATTVLTEALATSPDVTIDGFPFLTQWGTGRYDEATVRAAQVTIGRTRVNDFVMTLGDIQTPAYARTEEDFLASTAGTVRMSGTLPYSGLSLPSGVTAKQDGDSTDRLKVSGTVKVLGQRVRYTAVVKVTLQNGNVRLKPRRIEILGSLPSAALTGLVRDRLDIVVRLPGLPAGLQPSSLTVRADGIRIAATGRDIQIPKD